MPIFGGILEDMLRVLLQQAREVIVPAGKFFFRENNRASSMYVLQVGRVPQRLRVKRLRVLSFACITWKRQKAKPDPMLFG